MGKGVGNSCLTLTVYRANINIFKLQHLFPLTLPIKMGYHSIRAGDKNLKLPIKLGFIILILITFLSLISLISMSPVKLYQTLVSTTNTTFICND